MSSLHFPSLYKKALICHIVIDLVLFLQLETCLNLQTFYLGKQDLLTVYLGKLGFLSVTDFSLANLPRGNFIVWGLDMSRKQ